MAPCRSNFYSALQPAYGLNHLVAAILNGISI